MSEVVMNKVFEQSEDDMAFTAVSTATKWLSDNGFSFGATCRGLPTAIKKGDFVIPKWKHLTGSERQGLDGVMIGNNRTGPIEIDLYVMPESATYE